MSSRIRFTTHRKAIYAPHVVRETINQQFELLLTNGQTTNDALDVNDACLAAWCNRSVMGFALYELGDDELWVDLLAVDARYRRDGVGIALMTQLKRVAKGAGINAIGLHTHHTNLSMRNMLVRLNGRVDYLRYRIPVAA